jgi:hypothetical protein
MLYQSHIDYSLLNDVFLYYVDHNGMLSYHLMFFDLHLILLLCP